VEERESPCQIAKLLILRKNAGFCENDKKKLYNISHLLVAGKVGHDRDERIVDVIWRNICHGL